MSDQPAPALLSIHVLRCNGGMWLPRLYREVSAAARALQMSVVIHRVGFIYSTWFLTFTERGHSPKGSGIALLEKWYPEAGWHDEHA